MSAYRVTPCFILICLIPFVAQAKPLSLQDAVHRALTNNPSVTESQLGVTSSEESVKSAWGRHLPRLSLDANYTARQDPFPYIPAQSSTIPARFSEEFASYTIALSVPVYQGGQIVNGVELGRVRKAIQEQGLAFTRNEIIANTVNTYNKILQLRQLSEASRSSLKALEEQYANAQLLFKVGRIARVDLLKVEVQVANERQRLLSLNAGIATATATLQTLMGDRAGNTVEVPVLTDSLTIPEIQGSFSESVSTALHQRPEYLSTVQGINESGLNRKLARGKLLPTISAYGGYLDQFGFQPWHKEANWFAGINLSVPLFDRSLYADLSRQRIEADRAQERLKAVGNQVSLEVRSALNSLEESRERIPVAEQAIAQSQEAYRIEQQRYQSGAGAVVDLLLAQAADIASASNYTQALYDYNAAVVAYRKAMGTLEEYLK